MFVYPVNTGGLAGKILEILLYALNVKMMES